MKTAIETRRRLPTPAPLAASVIALFGLSVQPALANTWTVNTCDEGVSGDVATHSGTLRYTVANAASGDTIDMIGLKCSVITLKSGDVQIAQNDLILEGPGSNFLTITGKYNSVPEPYRIITHTGTGHLKISGLSVQAGYVKSSSYYAVGGCIASAGSVGLNDVQVSLCEATTDTGYAKGGAIYTGGHLYLTNSILSNNVVHSGVSGQAKGGGAYTKSYFAANNSTIKFNQAKGTIGIGGGLVSRGDATITGSTISGNSADYAIGGIDVFNSPVSSGFVTTITNSTISGNSAATIGGIYANSGKVGIQNSTIAFNTAGSSSYSPGLALAAHAGPVAVTLQSSLIANNTYGNPPTIENDVSAAQGQNPITFSGSHNLVRMSFASLPQDTISGVCPLLGPLRNNGGPTQTHALLSGSPGIDAGNNLIPLSHDQRGSPYPRESNVADIGSYEVDQNDVIFNAVFEGCVPLI